MRTPVMFFALLVSAMAETPEARVGQPLEMTDVYIPGGEVEPVPRRDRRPPLVVRLLDTKPAENGHRYDFEITGLDPGRHDLAEYLRAVNPEKPAEVPELWMEITSGLPEGVILPAELPPAELPELGGYKVAMIAAAGVWFVGFVSLVLWNRRKNAAAGVVEHRSPTVAERLRPLVRRASAGELDDSGRAALERLVIGHWREKLPEISTLPPAEAMVKLRAHPDAAPLIFQLERWLHAREADASAGQIESLLAPYR